ncbi:hypothetical protein NNJEOMEG_03289 [Fundidesulfovibrio magnetotacticus]|uniref:Uncharacterized protein n=1 Tax=Fundidesulfovibrio magnetotacticus TaxID=2730080 RepID=A0A6V8M065_9BACT|nr:XRE family transcriptional regulator [Fundidesulfovibrio magnetotacticus]GFK95426.1 hypothetical protein NNJEOMEG_03289 [Fundidesulfovibrio magnetotacticus]
MKTCFADNLTDLSREEKLQIFLNRSGLTFKAIGGKLDMSGTAAAKLCRGETIPVRRHAELVALGIPAEYLPRPEDIKPGPKPRRSLATESAIVAA